MSGQNMLQRKTRAFPEADFLPGLLLLQAFRQTFTCQCLNHFLDRLLVTGGTFNLARLGCNRSRGSRFLDHDGFPWNVLGLQHQRVGFPALTEHKHSERILHQWLDQGLPGGGVRAASEHSVVGGLDQANPASLDRDAIQVSQTHLDEQGLALDAFHYLHSVRGRRGN